MPRLSGPPKIELEMAMTNNQIESIVARIERLLNEADEIKAGRLSEIKEDISEIYKEAKGNGFDTKLVRRVVKERRDARALTDKQREELELYRAALGDLADMPLGAASIRKFENVSGN